MSQISPELQSKVMTTLFSLDRWEFLNTRLETDQYKEFIVEAVLPTVLSSINRLSDIADFTQTAFEMSHFFEICKSRNIKTETARDSNYKRVLKKDKIDGFYMVGKNLDFIWIKSGLGAGYRRFVAAHEISHFCLHRKALLEKDWLPATACLTRGKGQGEDFAEFEADLMAMIMVMDKTEVGE